MFCIRSHILLPLGVLIMTVIRAEQVRRPRRGRKTCLPRLGALGNRRAGTTTGVWSAHNSLSATKGWSEAGEDRHGASNRVGGATERPCRSSRVGGLREVAPPAS